MLRSARLWLPRISRPLRAGERSRHAGPRQPQSRHRSWPDALRRVRPRRFQGPAAGQGREAAAPYHLLQGAAQGRRGQRARLGRNEETTGRCPMMLQALAAYADRRMIENPDFFDPDFRWENAAWRIELGQDGKLNGVIPLKVKEGKRWQMKRVRRPYTDVNEISVRSLEKAKSYFLCDTLERVLLYADRNVVA